jgi:hypothetical protein
MYTPGVGGYGLDNQGMGLPHPSNNLPIGRAVERQFRVDDMNRGLHDSLVGARFKTKYDQSAQNQGVYDSMGVPGQRRGELLTGGLSGLIAGNRRRNEMYQGAGTGLVGRGGRPGEELDPMRPTWGPEIGALPKQPPAGSKYRSGNYFPSSTGNGTTIVAMGTNSGGIGLKGIRPEGYVPPSMDKARAIAADHKQRKQDARMIANVHRFGLSKNLPGYREAMARLQAMDAMYGEQAADARFQGQLGRGKLQRQQDADLDYNKKLDELELGLRAKEIGSSWSKPDIIASQLQRHRRGGQGGLNQMPPPEAQQPPSQVEPPSWVMPLGPRLPQLLPSRPPEVPWWAMPFGPSVSRR